LFKFTHTFLILQMTLTVIHYCKKKLNIIQLTFSKTYLRLRTVILLHRFLKHYSVVITRMNAFSHFIKIAYIIFFIRVYFTFKFVYICKLNFLFKG